jgi:hypothetical protein
VRPKPILTTPDVVTKGRLVEIKGQSDALVEQLKDPLSRALGERRNFYFVEIDTVGRVGQVLVSINGSRGRLPLLFQRDELEPGYVFRIVKDTVNRFGL